MEAIETTELREDEGVTVLTNRLAFRDQAGRDHITKYDGMESSFDHVEDVVMALLHAQE